MDARSIECRILTARYGSENLAARVASTLISERVLAVGTSYVLITPTVVAAVRRCEWEKKLRTA